MNRDPASGTRYQCTHKPLDTFFDFFFSSSVQWQAPAIMFVEIQLLILDSFEANASATGKNNLDCRQGSGNNLPIFPVCVKKNASVEEGNKHAEACSHIHTYLAIFAPETINFAEQVVRR